MAKTLSKESIKEPIKNPSKFFSQRKIIVMVIILILAGVAGYFGIQYFKLKQDPTVASQKEVQSLVNQVGKLIMLPEEENPALATVADPAALAGQAFFKNALKDDKVLIYTKSQKAILYRPSINKIIEVAPISSTPQK